MTTDDGATATSVAEYIDKATDAYRRTLEDLLSGRVPHRDPAVAGRRAAIDTTTGEVWAPLAGPFTDTTGAAAALGGITKQAVSQRVSRAASSDCGWHLAAPGETAPSFRCGSSTPPC